MRTFLEGYSSVEPSLDHKTKPLPTLKTSKISVMYRSLKPSRCTFKQESDHSDSEHHHQMVGGKKDHASGKDKMTKAQKRRHFDKYGAGAEKPRGWDWVPILSHVSGKIESSLILICC